MKLFSGRFNITLMIMLVNLIFNPLGAAAMQQNSNAIVNMLRLADQDYFQFDEDKKSQLRQKLIALNRYEGTALGSPASVDIEVHDKLPVLWATRASNLRSWQVVGLRNSTIIVSDLISGKVSVHNAFFGPKKLDYRDVPKSAQGSPKEVPAPRGATASCEMLDLREVASLPWHPGRFAITLLMYDWLANTVEVELHRKGLVLTPGQETALQVPKASAISLMQDYRRMAASPYPAFGFGASEKTPKLEGQGITLNVSETHSRMEHRWLIDGAAKLKLAAGNIIAQSTSTQQASMNASGPELSVQQTPAAVVNLVVLIVQLDSLLPRTINIQVPVASKIPLKIGDVAEVAFHVDITSALHADLPPADYQIYVVGNKHIAGPYPLNIARR